MSNDAELIKWMCFHLIFNSRLKCVRAICFCVGIVIIYFFFTPLSIFAFGACFISNPSLYHFACVYRVRFFFSLISLLHLFCRLRFILRARWLWWLSDVGLICLVKHANSSKGLFFMNEKKKDITNLACLFDSPSPFIFTVVLKPQANTTITVSQREKGLYDGHVWIYPSFVYLHLCATPFYHFNTAIFLQLVNMQTILSLFFAVAAAAVDSYGLSTLINDCSHI